MKHTPRKRFGQNFLQNVSVIANIIQAINPQPADKILEIGPGLGALTLPLLKVLNHLTVIEIDRDLQAYWESFPTIQNKLELVSADALQVDYSLWGRDLRVIGNLPYNISTPLLIRLLKFSNYIKDMYFMLQKEVVERIVAEPGSKSYGRLSIMMQFHCAVENLMVVPPHAFEPAPRVNSAVVRLVPYKTSPYAKVCLNTLQKIVASSFSMRRKTLANNLKGIVLPEQLECLEIDGNKRPEQITIEQYVKLAQLGDNIVL